MPRPLSTDSISIRNRLNRSRMCTATSLSVTGSNPKTTIFKTYNYANDNSQTDLLAGSLNVRVKNEEKITEQDQQYCQSQQELLYKTLN